METKIYVDAGGNLYNTVLKDQDVEGIKVVSMNLFVEDKNYHCYDDDINVEKFAHEYYDELRAFKNIHTSLINPNDFIEAFSKDVELGNKIICFTMASGISGTYQSCVLAANQINDEKGEEVVHVIDTKTAGFGEGLQAINAYKLVKEGKSFEEVCSISEELVLKVRSEFTVDNIKYLARTGRVTNLVAKIASLLNIKVLLKGSDEAKIVSTGKVHGKVMAIKSLASTCLEHIVDKENQVVYISHCDDLESANKLKELLVAGGIKNIYIAIHDLATGSHIGPGSVGVFYIGENRN